MAGVKGRSGGDRPDAPQSNFGVSAMGGAGSKEKKKILNSEVEPATP